MSKLETTQSRTCGSCDCWDRAEQAESGQCRVNSPSGSGWPMTQKNDWCVNGWRKSTKSVQAIKTGGEKEDLDRVGFNFEYVQRHPDAAMTWLKEVFKSPRGIPEPLKSLFLQPDTVSATSLLPVFRDCDDLFEWAYSIPGGEDKTASDAEPCYSMLMYIGDESERQSNLTQLAAMTPDHPWLLLCKVLAAKHLNIDVDSAIQ